MTENRPFVRWQAITREHFGRTANLLIGLATGLLAYDATLLLDAKLAAPLAVVFGASALVLLSASIGVGLCCAVNRLMDFRLTARIVRGDEQGAGGGTADRERARRVGRRSWQLLWWQIGLFGVGTVASGFSVLCQLAVSWGLSCTAL